MTLYELSIACYDSLRLQKVDQLLISVNTIKKHIKLLSASLQGSSFVTLMNSKKYIKIAYIIEFWFEHLKIQDYFSQQIQGILDTFLKSIN